MGVVSYCLLSGSILERLCLSRLWVMFMLSASCCAATIANSTIVLSSFIFVHSNGVSLLDFRLLSLFAFQSSKGGVMMLAPAVIRSGWAGPFICREDFVIFLSSFFHMTHLCKYNSWYIVLDRLPLFWYIPGCLLPVLTTLVLVRYVRILVSQCPVDFFVVVAFFCCLACRIY